MTTIKIFIFCFLFNFFTFTQNTIKLKREHFLSGCVTATASILPHYIAINTYTNNKNNPYSYLYTGVWFSFGLTLDIKATKHFIEYHKLKKKSLSL
jgi:4-amino-4-deoxy-L-arabinose transferase-like glycosyltransferase